MPMVRRLLWTGRGIEGERRPEGEMLVLVGCPVGVK